MANNETNVIWTDNENTRSLIWHHYWGFVDNFDKYMMYRTRFKRVHPVYKAGIYRYTISFYEEVRPFLVKFPTISNSGEIENIIYDDNMFTIENLLKVRRFISDFMFQSGIKNIVFSRDERNAMQRFHDNYNLSE